jgi:hypothetical protein
MDGPRPDRIASVALLVALGGGLAVLVGAFLAPVYSADGPASAAGSDTLVGVNGPGVAVVAAVPLLLAVAVAAALRHGVAPLGWLLTGVLAALNLVAMLTIGIFVLPVTVALVVACARTRPAPVPVAPR